MALFSRWPCLLGLCTDLGYFMNTLHSFVAREYRGRETAGRASKKTHMAMMETKVDGINILNEEKTMRVACA